MSEELEEKKKLDPVGQEDGDIDNDGDKDASDKYLAKRRKAISKAINEVSDKVLMRARDRAKQKADRAKDSADANRFRGNKKQALKDLDTADRKKRQFKVFDKAAAKRTRARLVGEETLNENKVEKLAKEYEKRVKSQGYSSRTHDRERMSILGKAKKQGFTAADMKALDGKIIAIVNKLDEAKSDYQTGHKTFSSAVQHAKEVVKKRGYDIAGDEWDSKVATGPRKPGKGKTNRYTINLMKGGKPVRQKLQMQVYYDEGRYELNMYID